MNKIIVIILLIIIYILFETLNLCNIDSFDNVNEYILPKVIYGFWDNLEENIVIQSHIRSWKKYLSSEWEIIILNKDNVHKYVDAEFMNKYGNGKVDVTRFSDFLRLELLTKNGGCWMDAGIFITNGKFINNIYNDMIQNKYDGSFYEFNQKTINKSFPYIENWFMMAPKESKILTDLYYEFNRAFEMDFLKYKKDVLIASKINLQNTIGNNSDNTYLLQHAIFHYLFRNENKYHIKLYDASESFFRIQEDNKWDNDATINYIMKNNNWNSLYAIKLIKANRYSIKDYKDYVRKIDSL